MRLTADIETVDGRDAELVGQDGRRARVPLAWLPVGARPGERVHLAVRRSRRRPEAPAVGPVQRVPWLDTLALLALSVGVAALVVHLFFLG